MSTYRIAVIPGDGIGPEIVAEAIKVLNTLRTISTLWRAKRFRLPSR